MSRRLHGFVFVFVVAGLLVFTGCSRTPLPRSEKPVIVCTIYPLTSVVKQIVGPEVEVVTAVPAGVSPHGFEPTARTVEAMQTAWLIVSVGVGYDEWAHTTAEKAGTPLLEMGASVTLPTAALEGAGKHEAADDKHKHDHDDHDHDHHHHHGSIANPHIWVDPVLMAEFVEKKLGPRLMATLNGDAAMGQRAAAVVAEIKAVDDEFRAKLAPLKGAKFVTYHNAFDLMAVRYGLEVAATLTPVDSPAGMTPKRLEQAIRVIKEHQVKAVYAEPQFPGEAGRVVQQETGVKVLMLDCLGDPAAAERNTYQNMMRYNLAALLEGLR